MNNLINKVRLELLSSDPHRALRLYLMIAFVDLVIFGFFGLYFSIASLKEKNIELKNVKSEEELLQNKKFKLTDAEASLKAARDIIPTLNERIPDQPYTHLFLTDLSDKAAAAGYTLTDIQTYEADDHTLQTSLRFLGSPSEAYKLFSVLESTSRLVAVSGFSFFPADPVVEPRIEAFIYKVSDTPLDLSESLNGTIDVEFLTEELEPAL